MKKFISCFAVALSVLSCARPLPPSVETIDVKPVRPCQGREPLFEEKVCDIVETVQSIERLCCPKACKAAKKYDEEDVAREILHETLLRCVGPIVETSGCLHKELPADHPRAKCNCEAYEEPTSK